MPRRRRGDPQDFYASALSEAERVRLPRARRMEGLDEEIALLRVRLRRLLEERPEDTSLLLRLASLLVRAVAVRYRISPRAEEDLFRSVMGVLKGVGGVLYPEGFGGEEGEGQAG